MTGSYFMSLGLSFPICSHPQSLHWSIVKMKSNIPGGRKPCALKKKKKHLSSYHFGGCVPLIVQGHFEFEIVLSIEPAKLLQDSAPAPEVLSGNGHADSHSCSTDKCIS